MHAEMLDLEDRVQHALATGDDDGLDVLGYGEVTVVVQLRTRSGDLACKRLPLFPDRAAFDRYRVTFDAYLEGLRAAGLRTPQTGLWSTVRADGRVVAYCTQPSLDRARVGHVYLREASEAEAVAFFDRVLAGAQAAITPRFGLDIQVSNWVATDDGLVYLDVTTPLLRDDRGREQLDVKVFMTSLPWVLRGPVRWTMSRQLFDKFYGVRSALVDLLANLYKERLDHLVPLYLDRIGAAIDPPLSEAELRAYYRGDARMWRVLQRLRRADRWWQRAIRRRPYPFLLPGAIER
jgi:hypothetical protein